VQVETLTSGITSISSGHYHACAITTAGGAICWGDNGEGELGNGGAVYPGVADVTGFSSGVGEITSGSYFTCAVTTVTASLCWGGGGNGELGAGSTNTGLTTPIASLDPAGTAPLTNMLTIAASCDSTCGVANDGTALCWGDNNSGELGDGSVTAGNSYLPVQVVSTSGSGTLGNIVELGTGENFTCSVNTTGGVVEPQHPTMRVVVIARARRAHHRHRRSGIRRRRVPSCPGDVSDFLSCPVVVV
jgi:alpha-tubulin suppressor-like RCC1 family protein